MQGFRFLHTADLHLGSPFQTLRQQLPESWGQLLRQAADTVFTRIVDTAIAEQVNFVTISGDLFDRDKAAMSAHFALLRGFLRLQAAGIDVVAIHGNHDPLQEGQSAPVAWPDNVHILGTCRVADQGDEVAPSVVLTPVADTRVQVSGFSYTGLDLRRSMHHAFHRQSDVDFAIGLYHGVVGDASGHDNYCPTSVRDLTSRRFDFWGLGHIHQPKVLQSHSPTVVYPGIPQGRHRREEGQRGCTLVDVQPGRHPQVQFVPMADVVFESTVVTVDECGDLTQVLERCRDRLLQQFGNPDQRAIVTLTLRGQTPAHKWLDGDEDAALNLRYELIARIPHILVLDILIETTPQVDLERLEQSTEFIGEFLRICNRYLTEPEAARRELLPVLSDVFHSGNDLDINTMTEDQIRKLVLRARGHVLAFVGEEGSD